MAVQSEPDAAFVGSLTAVGRADRTCPPTMRESCSTGYLTAAAAKRGRGLARRPADEGRDGGRAGRGGRVAASAHDPVSGRRTDVLDTCGTGGDGTGTFNISTAVAFVAAAAGVPVVKHGNRAVSGPQRQRRRAPRLGLPVEAGPDVVGAVPGAKSGLAFCFAPHFHPALTRLADLRRRLGVRTLFNCLGPLANPAGRGVPTPRRRPAGHARPARRRAGRSRHAACPGGVRPDGLDEVSLSGPTLVRRGPRRIDRCLGEWTPDDFGLEPCPTGRSAGGRRGGECGHDPRRAGGSSPGRPADCRRQRRRGAAGGRAGRDACGKASRSPMRRSDPGRRGRCWSDCGQLPVDRED